MTAIHIVSSVIIHNVITFYYINKDSIQNLKKYPYVFSHLPHAFLLLQQYLFFFSGVCTRLPLLPSSSRLPLILRHDIHEPRLLILTYSSSRNREMGDERVCSARLRWARWAIQRE
uniref:Uncharacterized protein n=1 Tax=Cucumis melo TaxID=3656 RepID=A0A9I9EHT8_CUCME